MLLVTPASAAAMRSARDAARAESEPETKGAAAGVVELLLEADPNAEGGIGAVGMALALMCTGSLKLGFRSSMFHSTLYFPGGTPMTQRTHHRYIETMRRYNLQHCTHQECISLVQKLTD
jgi:hypothetical protein